MPDQTPQTLADLEAAQPFAGRHIGPTEDQLSKMLAVIGYGSLEDLAATAVPDAIRMTERLDLPAAATEPEVLAELRALADANTLVTPMIGTGYSGTHTPGVILRNVLESPAWYTAYTPYQPEISQGRLEMLLNFQTVVSDLTGLDVSGASLLDESTAAAEALTLARRQSKAPQDAAFVVDADTHPQTLAVLRTRAVPLGLHLDVRDVSAEGLGDKPIFGVLLSYPGSSGRVRDLRGAIQQAHEKGALVAVATDLLALTLLESPGAMGADIAVGSSQRFGVPLGYGGPHAGFLAVKAGLARALPGRLVGVSKDADGNPALRLALQTREQHIRREKATSNICTAQVLLAVVAAAYAVHHGPDGLTTIARRAHRMAAALAKALGADGPFFDTLTVRSTDAKAIHAKALELGVELRLVDDSTLGISTDETTTRAHLDAVTDAFGLDRQDWDALDTGDQVPAELARTTGFLGHEVFHSHHSETAMLRYLRKLADTDLALDRSMIPLGSCTMKLNATTEMEPITWPEFGGLHPFTAAEHALGYRSLIDDLERWLAEITGYDAVSLQPNAGSQGELAGLLAIRGYHLERGEGHRDVCLIPASAHGTNAASAVMAGMRVVVVATTPTGDVDVADLRAKVETHAGDLSALMITYPSTHGVYEDTIGDVCAAVHDAGGQVYVDGANLNALVGLARPGRFGADVSHLNLHKTFCIPHGGGGPGVGPTAVRAHLAPFLPGHPVLGTQGAVSGAPYGSAGILPISWAYVRLMGAEGLTRATQVAVLSANYVATRLQPFFPVLYTGRGGLVAHECIVDLRQITRDTGVTVDDVAKRLVDYGFHAPTMSFPVAGTLMIEPTESEDLGELDRFVDAMIAIRAEIDEVAAGTWPVEQSPLRQAPHTSACLVGEWDRPYDRALGAFPGSVTPATKYWPPVRRIDGAHGDRNLVCSCPSPEELAEQR